MIIHVNVTYLLLSYLIAIVTSILSALVLGLPLLPKKPIRFSYEKSAIFPTPIFAVGFLAICFSVNFFWIYNGMVLAIFWGIVSGLFMKFIFDFVFPQPISKEEISSNDLENKDLLNNKKPLNNKGLLNNKEPLKNKESFETEEVNNE